MSIPPQTPPPYPPSRAQRAQLRMQSRMQRAAYRGLSRSSLLGPLLLIVIGVVALLITTHRINATDFWQWYEHRWPLVLIGAGVFLALESLAFSRYFAIRLGGGVVLLMVILAVLGIAAYHNRVNWTAIGDHVDLGSGVYLPQIFGSKHKAQEQIVHALPDDAMLVIQNPHGYVTIASGVADGQMHLTLDKTVYTGSDSEANRMLQALEPLITTNGRAMTVHVPFNANQNSDMIISIPASVAVEVQAANGNVTINGRKAAVTVVSANHGDVQLTDITGPVRVAMHQGDFFASNIQGNLNLNGRMNDVALSQITGVTALDGDFFGDVHLEKLYGPIHLHSSRTDIQLARLAGSASFDGDDLTVENATGPVSVATQAKDIALHRVTGEIRVNNSNGDVKINVLHPVGAMKIEDRNADVQVTLPDDAKFSVEAAAADGDIQNDFNLSAQDNDNRSTLSGTVAGGGPLIRISTEKGDITLHKNTKSANM